MTKIEMKPVPPTLEELLRIEKGLKEIDRRKTFHALDFYTPYPKQELFHNYSISHRERLLMAGNRVGKSFCGAAEMAFHLTGQYPDWWMGRRFARPIKAWAASDTGLTTRDVVQSKLCGPYADRAKFGTGAIPKDCVDWKNDVSLARGVTDLFDTVLVTHRTNGVIDGKSILTFKSYEQGRKKWQGEAVDVIWCDEEPDEDIYGEALARLAPTDPAEEGGIIFITFTPLLGRSSVVLRFIEPPSPEYILLHPEERPEDRTWVSMTLEDALHITPEARAKLIAGYKSTEREARVKGTPILGSGRVFETPEETIMEAMVAAWPPNWFYLWGIDFGVGHPFAAALLAWDKDADVIHILHTIRMKDAKPIEHAKAMKAILPGCPVAWPHDGAAREKSGEVVMKLYKKEGLNMLPEHATFPEGGYGTEAGVLELGTRASTARLKVAAHLSDWFEEYRFYHRKDGLIVKVRDDLLSATRIGVMMRRKAKQISVFGPAWAHRGAKQSQIADGVDQNLWGA